MPAVVPGNPRTGDRGQAVNKVAGAATFCEKISANCPQVLEPPLVDWSSTPEDNALRENSFRARDCVRSFARLKALVPP